MSVPISARIICAATGPIPGMASSRATAGASSPIWASMRACTVAMSAVIASTRCSIWVSRNAWCSVNRPVSASVSRAVLERRLPRASSASTAGSRSPAISAAIIARPETPNGSLTTTDSLISASSSSFSTRCFSAVRTASRSTR